MENVYSIFNPKQLGTSFGMMRHHTPHHTRYRPITDFLPKSEGHLHGELVVNFRTGDIFAQNSTIIKVVFLTINCFSRKFDIYI